MKYLVLLLLIGCSQKSGEIHHDVKVANKADIVFAEKTCEVKGGLSHLECNLTGWGFDSRHCRALCKFGYVDFEQL
ncbi:hypothetical protein N9948_01595 [bacterium]|nr:hypothetical protein [bacterium]